MRKHLPDDLERTLLVLLAYRNKMFHCGLEWSDNDLKGFPNQIASNGWADCFTTAEPGGVPWVFYLPRELTNHCLASVDQIIESIGAYERSAHWVGAPSDLR